MHKRERTIWIFAIVSLVIVWALTSTNLLKFSNAEENIYKNLRTFNEVLQLVNEMYVDAPDKEKLIYGAIDGMLGSLDDPYTRFMRKENFNDLKVETEGKFGGVGFVITKKDGWLTIIAPIDGTPASRAGLQPNDKIVRINKEDTKEMELNAAVSKLRGEPGTYVSIWVMRDENSDPVEYKLKREVIKVESVFSRVFTHNTKKFGYLKIKTFGEDTYDHLEKYAKQMDKENLNGLILDLRNDPGGLLYSAYKVADLFLDKGMIVYTKGRVDDQNKEYYASSIDYCQEVPMVVLANEGSASGSEIVIGALKDNKRAVVIGTKTFGKGVVQTVKDLGDGLGIAITTARYYTPSGVCIHKKGIEPNIEVDFQKTSTADIKIAETILKGHYLDDFVKQNKDFMEKEKKEKENALNELRKKLNSDKIDADYNLIRKLVKAKFYEIRGMNEALLDLEDDVQLKKAVEVLSVRDRIK
ncbi:MAG: S41 family peptidase [bacterium]|nr:S41 family peptidase [bacterium]